MNNKFLLGLALIIGAPLSAMEDVKVAALKPAEKPATKTEERAAFKKFIQEKTWQVVIAFIRQECPNFVDDIVSQPDTALRDVIDSAFSSEEAASKNHFPIFVFLLFNGAGQKQLKGDYTVVEWIEICADIIIRDSVKSAHWIAEKQRWLDFLLVAQDIFTLEQAKKQLFFVHYGKLADFDDLWCERQQHFAEVLSNNNHAGDQLLNAYVEKIQRFDSVLAGILHIRSQRAVHHLRIYDVQESMKEFLGIQKAEMAKHFGAKENFEKKWEYFVYELNEAFGHYAERREKPTTAAQMLDLFKTYTATALTGFGRTLESAQDPEMPDSYPADLAEHRALLAEAKALDAESLAQFAHKKLEALREELRRMDESN